MTSSQPRLVRVLFVEDKEDDYAYIRLLLERSAINRYQLDWAPTYEQGLAAVMRREHDVGLFDYGLGLRTGAELLREVAAKGCKMPIIMLTGVENLAIDEEGAASGAVDYLCKVKLDPVHLERSIRYALRHADVMAELHRTMQSLLTISDEEQRKIGADLHDGLGQHLTGIACLAAALRDQLKAEHSDGAAEKANHISGLVNAAIDMTRMHARGLCPVHVEQCGLHAALEDLVYQVQSLHNVQCRFENGGPPPEVEPEVALHLYRIAQEAINNAVRHGGANRIAVKLETAVPPLRLVVEDNGRGFNPAARPGNGNLGLRLMEHRSAIIGGNFSINPAQGGGVRVECVLSNPAHH